MDGVQDRKSPRRDHGLTAAPTTVADEVNPVPDVFTKLDQVVFISHSQQIKTLGYINLTSKTMPDQGSCRIVKCHTDILRRAAGPVHVFHLMPTVADPNAPVCGGLDDLRCPLIIEHMKRILFRKRRLMYKGPSELCFTFGE